ncbi:MAG: GAF domain-containing protein [Gomphosphaeria aponina SAG 52.96 = DSM 107014]|uniref:GAF domain-containing protein n=1 Tax=Gomphosphaeria aponina SAG 52.96 = DSM 107014 TaxID=1521640 RepID=A0A941GRZ7_9CHRO|nr:GAF domain-containing protein [Gomphosphaeria aponina SAG 52.96 = DSM 107014]
MENRKEIIGAIGAIKKELQQAGLSGNVKEQLDLMEKVTGWGGGELFKKERDRLNLILKEINTCNNLDSLLTVTTNLIRDSLKVDRVLIYRFDDNNNGKVITEALTTGWTPAKGETLPASCFGADQSADYAEKQTVRITGVDKLTPYQIQLLEKFQVKTSIALPIFQEEKIWGLLVAQQCGGVGKWLEADIHFLENLARELSLYMETKKLQGELRQLLEREAAVARVVQKIQQYDDLSKIFKVIVRETRQILTADRVVVYQFNPDFSGEVIAESAGAEWVSVIQLQQVDEDLYSTSMSLEDQCYLKSLATSGPSSEADTYFKDTQGGKYVKGKKISIINDVNAAGFSRCYLESLEKYQARAYVIVPIYQNEKLWGLLAAYQNSGPRNWLSSEVNLMLQLSGTLSMALQQVNQIEQLREQSQQMQVVTEQERVTVNIINRIRESLDLNSIFKNTTQEVRQLLSADRVGVYRFNPDFSGEFITESVGAGWVSVIEEQKIDATLISNLSQEDRCTMKEWDGNNNDGDTYFRETAGGGYARGVKFKKVDDIYQAGFSACYLNVLEKYQCRAYIIVPIFQEDKLWGLFAAYQNSNTRNWQKWEVELMIKIASQLSIAVQQAEYVQQLEKTAKLERGLATMIDRMRRTRDLQVIFDIATQESRRLLEVERCVIYRFNPDWSGEFIAESSVGGWVKLMKNIPYVLDTYLQETQGGRYQDNECLAVNNIYQAGHTECHIELLEQFEAKAYAIAPIFAGQQLWGLIAIYQNSTPRQWQPMEVNTLKQIGGQIGSLMQEVSYIEQLRIQSEDLAKVAQRETNFIRLLAKINQKIIEQSQQKLNLESLFKTSTQELRKLLKADRVAVIGFESGWRMRVLQEDVATGYTKLVATEAGIIEDPELEENNGGRYAKHQNLVVNDIYQAEISSFEFEFFEQIGAKACAIIPIFKGKQLWGLLATYQGNSRVWEEGEVRLLYQATQQLEVSIQLAEYLDKVDKQSEELSNTVEREKAAKEEIQKRVIDLLTVVQATSVGDLTVVANVTEDEVGTIAAAYNITLDSLREIIMQVQTAALQVAETTSDSTVAIDNLAEQAKKQFEELYQALDQIQEMVNATEQTTNNAQAVGKAVNQANQILTTGDGQMNKTVDSILGIRSTVQETSKRVKRLRESSQKISRVVSVIGDFAKQTNLLALNAALEATRAGEYGKGFAVVADEVRNLAHQSAEATTEIEKLVQEIQEETQEVATAMDTGIQQVAEGTNLVNDTRQSLNEIVAATAEINLLVEGITQATNTQTQQAESVTNVMTQVAAISQDTAENALKISSSFQELLVMAQLLQSSAGQFKVN